MSDNQTPPNSNPKPAAPKKANNQQKVASKPTTPKKANKDAVLLLKKCRSREEVSAWVEYFLGMRLPDKIVSRYATTTPLDIVWEMYRVCVLEDNPENIQEILYTGSRGSGKTLGVAIAEFMIMLHDQRDVAHVGAIMSQASRAYEYIQGFCMSPKVKPIIDPPGVKEDKKILQKSTMSKSIFNIAGRTCTMEILPTTLKALNGVHCQLVSCVDGDTQLKLRVNNKILNLTAKEVCDNFLELGSAEILSYSEKNKTQEFKKLNNAMITGIRRTIRIHFDDGTDLVCTPDHKIWLPEENRYVEAGLLAEGSAVLSN